MNKVITIRPGGTIEMIHDDKMAGLMGAGDATIRRASHVEPGDPDKGQDPLMWYADMAPCNGPVLGPFLSRQEALDHEVEWINTNVL